MKFQSILLNSSSDIKYSIQRIEPIRESDESGGYRLTILCQLENIRQVIPLDIATGDPITPEAIRYSYKRIFDESEFRNTSFNKETFEDVLMMLRNDDDLHSSWLRYQKRSPYAVEITFDKTLDVFEQIIERMGL